jgi:hypothetical protein
MNASQTTLGCLLFTVSVAISASGCGGPVDTAPIGTSVRNIAVPTNPTAALTTRIHNRIGVEIPFSPQTPPSEVAVTYFDDVRFYHGASALNAFVRVGFHDALGQQTRTSTDIPLRRSGGVYQGQFQLPNAADDVVIDFVEVAVSDVARGQWDSTGNDMAYHLPFSSEGAQKDLSDERCRIALVDTHRVVEAGKRTVAGTVGVSLGQLAVAGPPAVHYRVSGSGEAFRDVTAGPIPGRAGFFNFTFDLGGTESAGPTPHSLELIAYVPTRDGFRLFDHNTIHDGNVVLAPPMFFFAAKDRCFTF